MDDLFHRWGDQLWTVFALLIGASITGIGAWFRRRQEKRAAVRRALYALLDLRLQMEFLWATSQHPEIQQVEPFAGAASVHLLETLVENRALEKAAEQLAVVDPVAAAKLIAFRRLPELQAHVGTGFAAFNPAEEDRFRRAAAPHFVEAIRIGVAKMAARTARKAGWLTARGVKRELQRDFASAHLAAWRAKAASSTGPAPSSASTRKDA